MAKWLIKVIGKLPEMLEIEAANKDEAENDALNEVFAGIEILVEPAPEQTKLFIVQREKSCLSETTQPT